jgi:hypothetical protein
LYPALPSRFVAVGGNDTIGPRRVVWNLETMESVGSLEGKLDLRHGRCALSPDGRYLAGPSHESSERGVGVSVWSFENGERVFRSSLDGIPTVLDFVEFSAPDRLITCWDPGARSEVKEVRLVEVPGGGTVEQFSITSNSTTPPLPATSPGGELGFQIRADADPH